MESSATSHIVRRLAIQHVSQRILCNPLSILELGPGISGSLFFFEAISWSFRVDNQTGLPLSIRKAFALNIGSKKTKITFIKKIYQMAISYKETNILLFPCFTQ